MKSEKIKVTVSLDGISITMSVVVPKHQTTKKEKADHICRIASDISRFVENPK